MSGLPRGAAARLASIPMPARIEKLSRDKRGYPIPRFIDRRADKPDGEPDFRVMNPLFMMSCMTHGLCWICGDRMGKYGTFSVGPMCCVTLTTPEPPSHLECARYAVQVCPFLSVPEMRRIETGLPEGVTVAGTGIPRNPGVIALWTVLSYKRFSDDRGGVLIEMGKPETVEWWARARAATRDEIEHSIATGMPLLRAEAMKDSRPSEALRELTIQLGNALQYLPAETV